MKCRDLQFLHLELRLVSGWPETLVICEQPFVLANTSFRTLAKMPFASKVGKYRGKILQWWLVVVVVESP